PSIGHGRDTHSFMQLTDREGNVVAHELGGHLHNIQDVEAAARRLPGTAGLAGQVHAERMSIAALESRLKDVDVTGGALEVMVDQLPCSPKDKDCMGYLVDFADRKGLKLEVYVPSRPNLRDPSVLASPKTTASTAFRGPEVAGAPRTGTAGYRQIWPLGGAGPVAGGGEPPTPKPTPPAARATPSLAAREEAVIDAIKAAAA